MAYQKNTWETGDTITAEKLNNIEDGIAGGSASLIIDSTYDETTGYNILNKTWKEIRDAVADGCCAVVRFINGENSFALNPVSTVTVYSNLYLVIASDIGVDGDVSTMTFSANNMNDYPVMEESPSDPEADPAA